MIKHLIETTKHKLWVFYYLFIFCIKLFYRAIVHDFSKYGKHEVKYFIKVLPRLKGLTYGSKEYKDCLNEIKPAIDHHQKNNSHHPEYFENGCVVCGNLILEKQKICSLCGNGQTGKVKNPIREMSLLDIVEMFYDWKAATKRHANGDINASIEINSKRFNYDDDIKRILKNSI